MSVQKKTQRKYYILVWNGYINLFHDAWWNKDKGVGMNEGADFQPNHLEKPNKNI